MSQRILIVAEQRLGKLNPHSIETVVAAQRLAREIDGEVVIALFGNDTAGAAAELATAQAARLMCIEHELLEPYSPDGFCAAVRELVSELQPHWVVFPHTYQARDFAPRIAGGEQEFLFTGFVRQALRREIERDNPLFQAGDLFLLRLE